MTAGGRAKLPQALAGHRHTRLLYRELRDTIASELPAVAAIERLHCERDAVDISNARVVAEYAAYVARLRAAAGLDEGCGHCGIAQGRVVRFVAAAGGKPLIWSFVTCTTCGHCEQV